MQAGFLKRLNEHIRLHEAYINIFRNSINHEPDREEEFRAEIDKHLDMLAELYATRQDFL